MLSFTEELKINLYVYFWCVTQHQSAARQEDHRPDNVDTPSAGSGRCSAVLWLLHLNELLVFKLVFLYFCALCWEVFEFG